VPPTIVYLHGLNSSPQSVKARALGEAIAALAPARRPMFEVPALDTRPALAMRDVAQWVDAHAARPLTFVGSSLGGFYATHLAERFESRAVLINPSVRPYSDLERYLGAQRNLYTGHTWELTHVHFAELSVLAVQVITRPERYWLMVQTGDEVLDWREAVCFYAGAYQFVQGGGDHGFQDFTAQIPPLLRFAGVDAAGS
jgi:predicted esterase YcpF (UPF0227 family)